MRSQHHDHAWHETTESLHVKTPKKSSEIFVKISIVEEKSDLESHFTANRIQQFRQGRHDFFKALQCQVVSTCPESKFFFLTLKIDSYPNFHMMKSKDPKLFRKNFCIPPRIALKRIWREKAAGAGMTFFFNRLAAQWHKTSHRKTLFRNTAVSHKCFKEVPLNKQPVE